MENFFIEARYKKPVHIGKDISKLPNKLGLVATVQFIGHLRKIKKELEQHNKIVFLGKGFHAAYLGQVLGCDVLSASSIKKKVDAFIYIGTGNFHPLAISLQTKKDVFMFNPITNILKKFSFKESDKINKRKKASLIKFLSSNEIGIILTVKPGQKNLEKALNLKKMFKDKNFYFILFDTIDFSQLENFPFVECFVNTACPRIAIDDSIRLEKPLINIDEILASLAKHL
jgi:2-(3-amino-3-carboxypropyl)histidine synthase